MRTATTKSVKKNKKISKSRAVELMQNSGGKFFTVTFEKADGTDRTMNGRVRKKDFMSRQGYVLVRIAGNKTRSVNPRTISALKINKQSFRVG